MPTRLIISPILHFISSTLQPDSVLLYSRLNKYQYDLQLKCHYDRMEVSQLWVTDLRRSKLLFYPYPAEGEQSKIYFTQEDYYTSSVSNIDSASGSVRTPSTIDKKRARDESRAESFTEPIPEESDEESDAEYQPDEVATQFPAIMRPLRIIYDRWFTEFAVLSFHKVRQEKLSKCALPHNNTIFYR